MTVVLSPVLGGRGTGRTSDQVFVIRAEAIRDLRLPPSSTSVWSRSFHKSAPAPAP